MNLLLWIATFAFIAAASGYSLSLLFLLTATLLFRIYQDTYWEDKATLYGIIALTCLPLGGISGSILVFLQTQYSLHLSLQHPLTQLILAFWIILTLLLLGYLWKTPSKVK